MTEKQINPQKEERKSVKDLLLECSTDEIIEAYIDMFDSEKEQNYKTYYELVEMLKKRPAIESDYIVLGIDYTQFGEQYSTAVLFKISEIKQEFSISEKLDSISNVNLLSDEEVAKLLSERTVPDSYAYEFEDWNEILGYKTDDENIVTFGEARLLACVLYELTYLGVNEEAVEKERRALKNAVKDVKNIIENAEDNLKDCFVSWDEIKQMFDGDEIIDDAEPSNIQCSREMLENNLKTYQMLKRISGKLL